jgi:hypothetical protein
MLAVKEITDEKTWRDFIESVKPHTFLHSWQWGERRAQRCGFIRLIERCLTANGSMHHSTE